MSKASGDDWIGLTLGEDFDLRKLGMLYYVGASSQRLGDALRRLERYVRAGNEALVVRTQLRQRLPHRVEIHWGVATQGPATD